MLWKVLLCLGYLVDRVLTYIGQYVLVIVFHLSVNSFRCEKCWFSIQEVVLVPYHSQFLY